jgi:4-azaleucine resistance transporter AzlC
MPHNAKTSFLLGARAISPLVLGVVPFGLLFGAVAASAGARWEHALGMSAMVFAGAAQIAAAQLLATDAPLGMAVATALVVNARFAMYSASLAPHFSAVPRTARTFLPFFLTDQSYAACTVRFLEEERNGSESVNRAWYYAGTAVTMYPVWQVSTLLGAAVGARVPPELELEFAAPLTFLALLVPTLKDRPSLAAAVVAGAVSVLARGLPLNLSLLAAACSGIATGALLELRAAKSGREGGGQ